MHKRGDKFSHDDYAYLSTPLFFRNVKDGSKHVNCFIFSELDGVSLGYAISIHKSQGSEFLVIATPLVMQQYMVLQQNLIYTAITRAKKPAALIGGRMALAVAVRNNKTENRVSGLGAGLADNK
jgi:exodeoxyribonuclease V alpha subunit